MRRETAFLRSYRIVVRTKREGVFLFKSGRTTSLRKKAGGDAADAFCFELTRRFCRPYGTRFRFLWPLTRR